jgi:N-carbamoyl-L-amino-acid hydrolase
MAFGRVEPEVVDNVVRFDSGRTLAEHMREGGFDPDAVKAGRRHLDPAKIAAYIEVHIEQGPWLVDVGRRCAVVTGIRGNHRYKHGRALGQYGHAGGVPRLARRDALLAAVEWAHGVERHWKAFEAAGRDLVCTIGQFHTDAAHHTMTKIPGEVRFSLDIRSYDGTVLHDLHALLTADAERISKERDVALELGPYTKAAAAVMDPGLVSLARRKASELGIDAPDMASGAGHDCMIFAAEGVPCAMVFIRNDHGSHNADEAMEIDDFAEACRLATGMLEELAR